jgi:tubulin-specific chaperone D
MMDDEDINYEQLEFIIQFLLESLKDEDNVVRWTSAKGIGRITGRMNKEYAD